MVAGKIKDCPHCGALLIHVLPLGVASPRPQDEQEDEQKERKGQPGGHPGVFCPNGCVEILIEYSFRRATAMDFPANQFLRAAEDGNTAWMQHLLGLGIDLNTTNRWGQTALHLSSLHGRTAAVTFLLDQGADISVTETVHGSPGPPITALFRAAEAGHVDTVSLLLDHGADANVALWAAAGRGHLAVMQRTLDRGADPNARYGQYTALMKAVLRQQTEAARLLLARGADVDTQIPKTGRTALMCAAEQNFAPVMELLLEQGVDLEVQDAQGETALQTALRLSKIPMVLLLAGKKFERSG